MKYFLLLLVFTYHNFAFSQIDQQSDNDGFEEYAKPNPENGLSKYIINRINYNLLEDYKTNDTIESKNHVFLTFKYSKENKIIAVHVNSPYSELNESIKNAFTDYEMEHFTIPEKNPLNIYVLQILSKVDGKMVVNCSSNIVYESYPVFDGCQTATSHTQMKTCINKLLEDHIVKNISPAVIKNAKVLGSLNLYPKFRITEKGVVEQIQSKKPLDSLTKELNRLVVLFPKAKTPALRNGKPMNLFFKGSVRLQIDTDSDKYVADVIKSKDSLLNPNSELALHFKKFISDDELTKTIFRTNSKKVRIQFSVDKKGKMIDFKVNSMNKAFNSRLIEVFRQFPIEKLNITSTNVLESYNYTIITKAYPVNVIQCNEKPDVYIPPIFNKRCEKSDSTEELWKCLNENMSYYIIKNFDSNLRSKTNLTEDIRINCSFQIDADAKVTNVKIKAPNPSLANEMEEMLKDMPAVYKPAYLNGVAIKSSYTVPVVFKIGSTIPEDPFKAINKGFK